MTHHHRKPQARVAPLSFSAYLRLGLVNKALHNLDIGSVVEVGVGLGGMSTRLAGGRRYLGFEPDYQSYVVADARLKPGGASVVNSEIPIQAPPDCEQSFDLLVAFEVLEHIEADVDALRNWSNWVRAGGSMIISVPAHPNRYNSWDSAVGHVRRYSRAELKEKMDAAGLDDVRVWSYGFPLGNLLEAVRSRFLASGLEKGEARDLTRRSGRLHQPKGLNLARALATMPFRAIQIPLRQSELGIGFVAYAAVTHREGMKG